MDQNRTLLAIALSLAILLGYQYFFVPPIPQDQQQEGQAPHGEQTAKGEAPATAPSPMSTAPAAPGTLAVTVDPEARDITVDTPNYTAVISEQGGTIKSFLLKAYRRGIKQDSGPMELAPSDNPGNRPLAFSLDNAATSSLPRYTADNAQSHLEVEQGTGELRMTTTLPNGLEIVRSMRFSADSYLIPVEYTVNNPGDAAVQISPALIWHHQPFPHENPPSSYLFAGPEAWVNNDLVEIKEKALLKGPVLHQGAISWAGYSDSYFLTACMPGSEGPQTLSVQAEGAGQRSVLSGGVRTLEPKGSAQFSYTLYMGPKKLTMLQAAGHDLSRAVDYGWLTVIAQPMLWLLNFFHSFTHNYGVAIILLTIVIKAVFWPVTQKGMKSMKNMQKLQPKITKLREKFKKDPAAMNREMMNLYKTYKVNPMGGCLPMVIQIPFFFALYRVLMQAIELRHAPFMLWINDLSMPDRLWLGFDIPWLHGLPVLTLLMGASMFLQQKMTPTPTADPTQLRIMQWLPIIFTFMFINFASGLVLYWFINNLLTMLQQYLINRSVKA